MDVREVFGLYSSFILALVLDTLEKETGRRFIFSSAPGSYGVKMLEDEMIDIYLLI